MIEGQEAAIAKWTTSDDEVRRAASEPEIAAVLEQSDQAIAAITSRDTALFDSLHAPELRVNSPINRVVTGEQVTRGMPAGMIDDERFDRAIEYAGKIPGGLIVLMGEEQFVPRALAPHAGRLVRRRFTDIAQCRGRLEAGGAAGDGHRVDDPPHTSARPSPA